MMADEIQVLSVNKLMLLYSRKHSNNIRMHYSNSELRIYLTRPRPVHSREIYNNDNTPPVEININSSYGANC